MSLNLSDIKKVIKGGVGEAVKKIEATTTTTIFSIICILNFSKCMLNFSIRY